MGSTIITDIALIRGTDDQYGWHGMSCGSIIERDGHGVAAFSPRYLVDLAELISDQDRFVIKDHTYTEKWSGETVTDKHVFCNGDALIELEQASQAGQVRTRVEAFVEMITG